MKSYPFLYWAYNVFWVGIAAYLAFLAVRLHRVRRQLEALERRLQTRGEDSSA